MRESPSIKWLDDRPLVLSESCTLRECRHHRNLPDPLGDLTLAFCLDLSPTDREIVFFGLCEHIHEELLVRQYQALEIISRISTTEAMLLQSDIECLDDRLVRSRDIGELRTDLLTTEYIECELHEILLCPSLDRRIRVDRFARTVIDIHEDTAIDDEVAPDEDIIRLDSFGSEFYCIRVEYSIPT